MLSRAPHLKRERQQRGQVRRGRLGDGVQQLRRALEQRGAAVRAQAAQVFAQRRDERRHRRPQLRRLQHAHDLADGQRRALLMRTVRLVEHAQQRPDQQRDQLLARRAVRRVPHRLGERCRKGVAHGGLAVLKSARRHVDNPGQVMQRVHAQRVRRVRQQFGNEPLAAGAAHALRPTQAQQQRLEE
eukprot:5809999-Prymnesium_polylepis.1